MDPLISSLFIIPAVVSGLILILPKLVSRILVISVAFLLSGISIYLFVSIHEPYRFGVPKYFNQIVATADIILLVFFAWIAVRRKSLWVGAMSLLQLGALLYVLNGHTAGSSLQFMVDKLSLFM